MSGIGRTAYPFSFVSKRFAVFRIYIIFILLVDKFSFYYFVNLYALKLCKVVINQIKIFKNDKS